LRPLASAEIAEKDMYFMKNPFDVFKDVKTVSSLKTQAYIEIVGSSNPRLNAMAEDSQLTMLATLRKHYTKVAITIVDDLPGLERLVAKKPDLVVLGMKLVLLDPEKGYDDSRKVWLSDYLEEKNINFTGSGTAALTLEFDKHVAKRAVIDAGLQSSAFFISRVNKPTLVHNLRFPLFVKPTNRGDSKGIDESSVVHSKAELESKIRSIHNECSSDALIEEYLPGREFSVAVIKQADSEDLLAMPVEITSPMDANGNSFLSEAVKQADSEKVIAVIDPELKNKLNALAMDVFKALGARDYGRIDMRLDSHGVPSFIEANLMPGLSNHGYLMSCFSIYDHTTYDDMILGIVRLALGRDIRPIVKSAPANLRDCTEEVADLTLQAR
jgi:D-alanine-D-alanine ligase